jgi:hypothetical protein
MDHRHQTIRNRWAHAPVSGIPDDKRYRDLDTIERLMQAIGADQPTLADIHAERTALLTQLAGPTKPADQPTTTASQGAFDPGQLVRLKAQPGVTGAVVTRVPADPEDRYQVGDPDPYTLLHLLRPDLLPSSRELASRVFGLASYLESILDRHLSQLEYPSRHRRRPRCGSGLDHGPQSWRHCNNERQNALRAPSDLPLRPDRNGYPATPAGRRGAPARAEVSFGVYSGPAAHRRLRQRARQGRPQASGRTGRTYTFVSVRTLLDDFWADVRSLTDE